MSLITTLTSTFADAFESQGLDRSFGQVVVSARPDLAQFQCNGAMAAAKQAKKNPREVAQAVLDSIPDKAPFSELDLAGPGFINITLTDEYPTLPRSCTSGISARRSSARASNGYFDSSATTSSAMCTSAIGACHTGS